jgi:ABC-type antimicrobial peptide transport system permease subunit
LTRDFPNLTIVDVGGLLRQVQTVLDQVVTAVEFLFIFTLASGVLVLYAALMGSQDERTRESGLLRALGATRRQLSQAQLIEFSLVGALSGVLAASGAAVMGWALATYQFKFEWVLQPVGVAGRPGGGRTVRHRRRLAGPAQCAAPAAAANAARGLMPWAGHALRCNGLQFLLLQQELRIAAGALSEVVRRQVEQRPVIGLAALA